MHEGKILFSLLRFSWQVLLWKAELWGHRQRKLWARLQWSGMGAVQQAVSEQRGLKIHFDCTYAQRFYKNLDCGGCCRERQNSQTPVFCFIKPQILRGSFWSLFDCFLIFSLVSIRDVLCGLLLCTNLTAKPRFGELQGKLTSLTIHHQNRYMDCRWGSFFCGSLVGLNNNWQINKYRRLPNQIWIVVFLFLADTQKVTDSDNT